MKRQMHLDDLLAKWSFDPSTLNVRLVKGKDGRDVIQMRVDMGILQLETTGRPDGEQYQWARKRPGIPAAVLAGTPRPQADRTGVHGCRSRIHAVLSSADLLAETAVLPSRRDGCRSHAAI